MQLGSVTTHSRQKEQAVSDWRKMFVGRDDELQQLIRCWDAAQAGTPQLAVLLAPPGMGKTRLVQEFYNHVSKTHDGAGEDGYWPDQLGRERDRFALSCPVGECNPANPITMLWWAIKCIDPGSNNAASGDLLLAYNQFLKPHLDLRRTDEQRALLRKEQLKEGARGVGEIGIAAAEKGAELIPVIGPFVGLAKAIGTTIVGKSLRLRELEKERARLDAERLDLSGKAASVQDDFEDVLMGALGNFARPRSEEMPVCPIILVIDDAQFADQDPALRSFLRRFIDTAWAESWPVLVIMTHWTYEWNLHGNNIERIPGLVQTTVKRGLMEASVIPLGKITALDQVLAAAVPKLPEEQAAALLEKAGGNARYLDRLVQLLLGSPAMFVTREALGALHEDALEEILREGFDLHDVTRRLFDLAPDEARRAAALASMQGERFLHELVAEVGERVATPPLDNGLEYCANPLAVISDASPGIGEFSQGMFREVARSLVSRTVDRESVVKQALLDLCKEKLDDWRESHLSTNIDPVTDLLLLDLIIGLTQKSDREENVALNMRASLRKGELLADQGDLIGARGVFDKVDCVTLLAMTRQDHIEITESLLLPQWRYRMSDLKAATTVIEPLIRIASQRVDDLGTQDAKRNLREAEGTLGDVLMQIDGPVTARPHFERYLALSHKLADVQDTPDARRSLALAESKLGDVLMQINGPATARPHFECSLGLARALADELDTAGARRDLGVAESKLGEVLLQIDGPVAARPYLERSLALCRALADELGTPDTRRGLGVAENRLGEVLLQIDGPVVALPHFERSLALCKALADELGTPDARRDLSIAESRLGGVRFQTDGPVAALPHFERALALSQTLAEEIGTLGARRGLGLAESKLGEVVLEIDGAAAALPHFERSMELFETLSADLDTPGARRSLGVAKRMLGDVLLQTDGPATARPYFVSYLEVSRALADELDTPGARRDLAVAESRLGDLLLQNVGPVVARPHFECSLAAYKALADKLGTSGAMRDLAIAESRLGDVLFRINGAAAARAHFERYLALSQALADDLGTPGARRELGVAEQKMGEVLLQIDGPAAARSHFERSLKLSQILAEEQGTPDAQRNLGIAEIRLGEILLEIDGPDAAFPHLERCLMLVKTLAEELGTPQALADLEYVSNKLASIKSQQND